MSDKRAFPVALAFAAVLFASGGLSVARRSGPAAVPEVDLAAEACTVIMVGREA